MTTVLTERLELRLPTQADRARFTELFRNDAFMAFSGGVLDQAGADARFDKMLATAQQVPFAKQAIVERSTGRVLGYSGVAWFEYQGKQQLEFGYRLDESARGLGYATEAGLALLDVARTSHRGTIYAMIDPTNQPSQRVADKLGFEFLRLIRLYGYVDKFYRITFP